MVRPASKQTKKTNPPPLSLVPPRGLPLAIRTKTENVTAFSFIFMRVPSFPVRYRAGPCRVRAAFHRETLLTRSISLPTDNPPCSAETPVPPPPSFCLPPAAIASRFPTSKVVLPPVLAPASHVHFQFLSPPLLLETAKDAVKIEVAEVRISATPPSLLTHNLET